MLSQTLLFPQIEALIERGVDTLIMGCTIAEFVESTQIEQALIEIGVDYAQGYIVQRPQLFTFDSLLQRPERTRALTLKSPGTLR